VALALLFWHQNAGTPMSAEPKGDEMNDSGFRVDANTGSVSVVRRSNR
jgi:hypothetical protein